MRLIRGDQVRYEVESVDEDEGTIEMHLMFENPSNVSNKMVSYETLKSSIGIGQTWGLSHPASRVWKWLDVHWAQGRTDRK